MNPARLGKLFALAICALASRLGVPLLHAAAPTAAELGRAVRSTTLDPAECYRVHDLEFAEADARFYLSGGYLIIGKPVQGGPVAAVFTADIEGGDAEVMLFPPDRSERQSLAKHTGTPNLDEHFTAAIFLFTDSGVRELLKRVRSDGGSRKAPDIGALMADRWNSAIGNIISNFEPRMVLDLISADGGSGTGSERGFFEAVIQGRKLGNFDVLYDSRYYEQMNAGQRSLENGKIFRDTWTSFSLKTSRDFAPSAPEEQIIRYRIDATLDQALTLHCVTQVHVRVTQDSRHVIPFDFPGKMHATAATIDGEPAEVYRHDNENYGEELLLVVPSHPLEPGSEHDVEIRHEGKVVLDAGNKVYFAAARGDWYPARGLQFARYDVTWHYPKEINLVATGEVKEDRTEGDMRVTRRVPGGPVAVVGFNLGRYESKVLQQGPVRVEVFANQEIETALRPRVPADSERSVDPVINGNAFPARRRIPDSPALSIPIPPPVGGRPADELTRIAGEVAAAMEFYKARFGAPPLNYVEVSPVPGRFGQGYAGMIYLSTLSYLPVSARPLSLMSPFQQVFFGELMRAHETAHQWWGNIVTAGSYHHEWLPEALANYSAILFLESRKGPKFIESVLDEYRGEMLLKNTAGELAESAGPLVQGNRLDSPSNPNAWTAIIYGKGTWVIHMLRRRMGDAQFTKMLAEVRRRYEYKTISTEEFRLLCAEFLPPKSPDPKLEDFFDQWVYGTGIPTLKMKYSVSGKPGAYQMTGTVTQTDAPDDLTLLVPVVVQTGGKQIVKQVRTASEPVQFTVAVTSPNAKAILDPGQSVLRR